MSTDTVSPNRSKDFTLDELLCQLIAIPSCNPMEKTVDGTHYFENQLSDWLVDYFESLGVPWERLAVFPETTLTPRRDNVLAIYENPASSRVILLDAHQDTVPVEGMTISPFVPTRREGRVYGRGAVDVKGAMASMLAAFTRLCRERPAGAATVILSCSCDEESTAQGVQHLARYWGHQTPSTSRVFSKRPTEAIIAEPTELDVVVAHRGVIRFRIEVAGHACHSSQTELGDNAIYRMADVVQRLRDHAIQLEQSSLGHPMCGGPRLSVGRIQGGTAVNIVPDACMIEVDRRLIPGENPDEVMNDYHAMLADFGDRVRLQTPWLVSPPLGEDANGQIAARLLAKIEEVTGKPHRSCGVPFGTNASTIAGAGIPAVVFGPGSIQQAHTADEWIEMSQVEKAAEIFFRYLTTP